MSQTMKFAKHVIGNRNIRLLQENGLTVVPLKLMEQLKTVKEQQMIIIDGVALTVKPFEEKHLETAVAGYVCWD
ncbi:hypothetical protein D3P09_02425 [Paenibacillus pinisoli]|uniref:Uncharacterized protein n=1 Tax=Paenibacillus pinisoli TaxID=1276110 RepID=A0A3A6PI59_9BACL|nr:hypothetical protein [Paenibacillus pinisoli]RJX40897.1 hypothetical protein D3P09_02425 [Paenibacillus pinisoli]